jgi:hypothetical protein
MTRPERDKLDLVVCIIERFDAELGRLLRHQITEALYEAEHWAPDISRHPIGALPQ